MLDVEILMLAIVSWVRCMDCCVSRNYFEISRTCAATCCVGCGV